MSFIVEFHIVSPLMREPAKAAPEMVLHQEDVDLTLNGEIKSTFWASSGDFDAFESALQDDSTIQDYTCLTEIDGRRLYRVTHPKEATEEIVYPESIEQDVGYLDITTTHEGTSVRARFPTLEALKCCRESYQEQGIPFKLQRVYEEESDNPVKRFGLTSAQYEVLVRAHEQGYFTQPRNVTLEELAGELEVSSSALGRRMRRGLDALIERTLRSKNEGTTDQT